MEPDQKRRPGAGGAVLRHDSKGGLSWGRSAGGLDAGFRSATGSPTTPRRSGTRRCPPLLPTTTASRAATCRRRLREDRGCFKRELARASVRAAMRGAAARARRSLGRSLDRVVDGPGGEARERRVWRLSTSWWDSCGSRQLWRVKGWRPDLRSPLTRSKSFREELFLPWVFVSFTRF